MKNSGILKDMRDPVLKWGYIFAIPGMLSYLLFSLYPTLRTFYQSFFLIRGAGNPWVFSFFDNYREILTDRIFWDSLLNTFVYVLMTVPVGTLISLIVAIVLSNVRQCQGIFRSLFFIPSVAGLIVVGIVFTWMYEPYNGLLNLIFSKVGLGPFTFLRDKTTALASIAGMTIWRVLGYNVVILMAGLLSIPKTYYEAADIDGVGYFRKHLSITIPLIAPTLTFVMVNNTIRDLQVFSEIFVMTGGGPGHATTTIGYRIYQNAFLYLSFGKAAANAVVLMAIIILITVLQMKFLNRKDHSLG